MSKTLFDLLSELERSLNDTSVRRKIYDIVEKKSFKDFISPGCIVDVDVKGKLLYGIILYNNVLLLIDPGDHTVKGYLSDYTETVPYNIKRIRKPSSEGYKYTDPNVPVIWEAEEDKVEMSLQEIEEKLGLKSGTLSIK